MASEVLEHHGADLSKRNMVDASYINTRMMLQRNGVEDGQSIPVTIGLPQGTALSPMIFNLVMNYVLESTELASDMVLKTHHEIYGEKEDPLRVKTLRFNHLLYADDIALCARTKDELRERIDRLNKSFLAHGLFVLGEKAERIEFHGEFVQGDFLKLTDGKKTKRVDSFIYLGSVFIADCKCYADIERSVQLAKIAYGKLNSLLWSPRMSKSKKPRPIMCLVYLVVSCACEN